MKPVVIGMAEMNIVKPPETIITYGLGSCVGLVLYDKINKMAGMVHIVLPNYNKNTSAINVAKFADTAVTALLNKMVQNGAHRAAIIAKMAGGAHMFTHSANANAMLKVGERNVEVTKQMLKNLRIPLLASDVLGTCGRTVEFDPASGMLRIKTVGQGEKQI